MVEEWKNEYLKWFGESDEPPKLTFFAASCGTWKVGGVKETCTLVYGRYDTEPPTVTGGRLLFFFFEIEITETRICRCSVMLAAFSSHSFVASVRWQMPSARLCSSRQTSLT